MQLFHKYGCLRQAIFRYICRKAKSLEYSYMKKITIIYTLIFLLFGSLQNISAQKQITPEWLWSLGRVSLLDVSEQNDIILYQVKHYDIASNSSSAVIYAMDMDGKNKRVIYDNPDKIGSVAFHPTFKKIAYLKKGTLYTMNFDGTDEQSVGGEGINSYKYSPDGSKIAFIKDVKYRTTLKDKYAELDQSNVQLFDDLMYRHWDHWEDDSYSNIFVQDIKDGVLVDEGENIINGPYDTPLQPFGGMEQITWSPNGEHILYTIKLLEGKEYALSTNSDIYAYHLKTKTVQNLTKDNKGYDMDPQFSPDGKYLVYNRMVTPGYEADKKEAILRPWPSSISMDISKGKDQNFNQPTFSPDNKYIYFTSGIEATYQLFRYDIKDKKVEQITDGVHNINDFIPVSDGVITRKNSMTDAHEIFHVSVDGKMTQLTDVNAENYEGITKAQVKHKWVTTTDGKKMKVWYILPPDFDPNKKYPTLLYCQGGPQSPVSQFFSYRWNFQIMAAHGYVIVAPNRRGLPSFGQEWNHAISKDWGGQAIKDYLSAIDDAIENEPYVDKDRVGAVGASYGGYSVYYLAGNHDGRFKSFISHCGLFNLESWYGTTEELFFANYDIGGPYWDESLAEDYRKNSPHTYADNWDTPILVIHGGKDFRVPLQEGMQAFQLAQLKGIKSKFLYFPDEGHWVLSPQNGIIWQKEFFEWLRETLKE